MGSNVKECNSRLYAIVEEEKEEKERKEEEKKEGRKREINTAHELKDKSFRGVINHFGG